MKKRSPGSKLLAVIFALLFTMIVNLAFVCFHFLNVFLQEDNFHAISKQVILNHQVIGDILASVLNDELNANNQTNNSEREWSEPLNGNDLKAFLNLSLPEDLISTMSYNVVSGTYKWLENEKQYPEITVELIPFKENMIANLAEIVDAGFSCLPLCTSAELTYFLQLFAKEAFSDADTSFYNVMPKCKLQEPLFGSIKMVVTASIIEELAQIPDTLNLTSVIDPQDATSSACIKCHSRKTYKKDPHLGILSKIKRSFNVIRAKLNYIWILPAFFLISAILFGSSGFKSSLRWLGLPLLLSGLLSLLIIFHLSGDSTFVAADVVCDVPGSVCPSYIILSSFVAALFNKMHSFMHLFAISQIAGGSLLIYGSFKLK